MLYPVAVEEGNDDHAFGVVVPDMPGCFSAGDTLDEALQNVTEAIVLFLEDYSELPAATELSTLKSDPEFEGWTWHMIEVEVDV